MKRIDEKGDVTSSNLVQLLLRLANKLLQRIANHDVTLLRPVLTVRSGGRCVVGERGVGVDVDGCDLLQDVSRATERLKGSIGQKQRNKKRMQDSQLRRVAQVCVR